MESLKQNGQWPVKGFEDDVDMAYLMDRPERRFMSSAEEKKITEKLETDNPELVAINAHIESVYHELARDRPEAVYPSPSVSSEGQFSPQLPSLPMFPSQTGTISPTSSPSPIEEPANGSARSAQHGGSLFTTKPKGSETRPSQ